ncbi:major capsid protein, partial [Salmonella enterica]|uniref:major capsid protein n=1 Tax=Salmonella enterica TaxID=28901 RepID=UPI003211C668
ALSVVPAQRTTLTLLLASVPPPTTEELPYLLAPGAFTAPAPAGDPVSQAPLPPRDISLEAVFRSVASATMFKIAEGQWYRYAPSYVSPAYHLLDVCPFIQEPPAGELQELVLISQHDYDHCYTSVRLLQSNCQVNFNLTVYCS